MSTNTTLKSSAIAVVTLAGLSLTVAANAQSSRYGNVYDYESGRNCGQACAAREHVHRNRLLFIRSQLRFSIKRLQHIQRLLQHMHKRL